MFLKFISNISFSSLLSLNAAAGLRSDLHEPQSVVICRPRRICIFSEAFALTQKKDLFVLPVNQTKH